MISLQYDDSRTGIKSKALKGFVRFIRFMKIPNDFERFQKIQ